MSEKTSSFSNIGRLGRKAYWISASPLLAAVLLTLVLFIVKLNSGLAPAMDWALGVLACIVVPALNVLLVKKTIARLHDVGSTAFFGWFSAFTGCLLAVAFVVFVCCGLGGMEPDPLEVCYKITFWTGFAAALTLVVQSALCLISRVPGTNDYGPAAGCEDKPFAGTCWGGIVEDMLKLMLVMGFLGYLCKLLQEPFTTPTPTDSLISLIHKGGVKDDGFAKELGSQMEAGGASLAEVDKQGRTLLMLAITTGINSPAEGSKMDLHRLYYLRQLLATKKIAADAADKDGKTALHYAAEYGMTYCCMALVKDAGLDVSAEAKDGRTPAQFAIDNGHTNTARALLQLAHQQEPKKANPLLKLIADDAVNDRPFSTEMTDGTADSAKNGQVFVNQGDNTQRTPLMMTVYANFNNPRKSEAKDLERLYYLKELLGTKDIDVMARDKDGFTALHWGSWSGMPYCCLVLVNEGKAEINATDSNGYTPLMLAALRGNAEVVRMLLQLGADDSLKNKEGKTALELATEAADAYAHRDSWMYTLVYSPERMADYEATKKLLSSKKLVLSVDELDRMISESAKKEAPAEEPAPAPAE